LALCAPPLLAQISVRKVQVLGSRDVVEIEVESSDRIVPQTRVLTSPDRLVVDFPNATPGAQLRSQSVERGQVKDLRIGLFESKPPVTRIVIDLKAAQSYQVFPSGRTVIIKVMGGAAASETLAGVDEFPEQASRPGLVAANFRASAEPLQGSALPKPAVEVTYRNGLLAVRANRATLSEVLNAIQQRTGAQISGAPGAEQERVVVDIPAAPAPDVLARLLYGSRFNFLIVSAANNPRQLQRVILTQRGGDGNMPLPQVQSSIQADDGDTGQASEPGRPQVEPGPPLQTGNAPQPAPPSTDDGERPPPPEIIAPGGDDPPD
jgi:hypothetical protein